MRTVYLSAHQEFLQLNEARIYVAMGMLPGDDEFTPFPDLVAYVPIIEPALRDAVSTGMVTLRDPKSFLPLPAGDRELPPCAVGVRQSFPDLVISRADFQQFCASLGVDVQMRDDDYDAPNEMGYTIEGAAKALAQKYGISARGMKGSIVEATQNEKLRVRNPKTGMPCNAKKYVTRSEDEYRISVTDLNEWLESSGVPYELEAEREDDRTNTLSSTSVIARGIDRNEVMRVFAVRPTELSNRNFWDEKLGRPPEWLVKARVSRGKRGRSARWDPLSVAHALLGGKYMNLRQLDSAMHEHFPELLEQWKDDTSDLR